MPFKLALKTGPSSPVLHGTEKEFDESVINIGRAEASDVRLQDSKRLVSSRHAQIRHQVDQYVLVDVESTNGTRLNGQRLEAKKEYPLTQHDEIGIGEFVLEFLPLTQEPEFGDGKVDAEETLCLVPTTSHFEKVVERLRQIHRENLQQPADERSMLFMKALRESVQSLDLSEADHLLSYVEATFPDAEFQQERILREPPGKRPEPPPSPAPMFSPSMGVDRVASHYLPSQSDSLSPESLAQLSERVDQVLAAFLEHLVDAIRGRQQFEKELDVEVTRILGRERGKIKWADSPQEIGEILFGMQQANGNPERMVEELRHALADLALHPIGLMAGFRECVRGFLKQLDPAIIESEARAASGRLGALAFGPFFKSLAWDWFTKKHRMLLEEEVKTFQNLLGPEFAKGYLRVYEQTKSP